MVWRCLSRHRPHQNPQPLPTKVSFFSVQRERRMIGIYGPQNFRQGRSAKAVLIWTQEIEQIDEIWVDGEQPTTFRTP